MKKNLFSVGNDCKSWRTMPAKIIEYFNGSRMIYTTGKETGMTTDVYKHKLEENTENVFRKQCEIMAKHYDSNIIIEIDNNLNENEAYTFFKNIHSYPFDASSQDEKVMKCSYTTALKLLFINGIYGNDTVQCAAELTKIHIHKKLQVKWAMRDYLDLSINRKIELIK